MSSGPGARNVSSKTRYTDGLNIVEATVIAIRVDAGVLQQFRKEARRRRVGYQTLINEVLAKHARNSAA